MQSLAREIRQTGKVAPEATSATKSVSASTALLAKRAGRGGTAGARCQLSLFVFSWKIVELGNFYTQQKRNRLIPINPNRN